MQTFEYRGLQISRLGFGAMRLPLSDDETIDEDLTQSMVDYAIEHGVNYFDTAYPYHDGLSELVLGRCLTKHPRDSFFLATKFPGHQIADTYDPAAVFEEQLMKCGVDYFDFYLLHNIYENSIKTYLDPQWGILEYFVEQRRLGRIRYLGFSTHGRLATIKRWLDHASDKMDFIQLQVNYLDWTLQNAEKKYALAHEYGIPIWVMEGVRGGTLANLSEDNARLLREKRPNESPAAWALRWVANRDVGVVLSGMSDLSQLKDNIRTFSEGAPLSEDEEHLLAQVAESMKDNVPCTACRYCTDSCPQGLDIPTLLELYNDMRVAPTLNTNMLIEAYPEDKRPGACIACGACTKMCPQNIDIPTHLNKLALIASESPHWEEVSRKRAQIAAELRKNKYR